MTGTNQPIHKKHNIGKTSKLHFKDNRKQGSENKTIREHSYFIKKTMKTKENKSLKIKDKLHM